MSLFKVSIISFVVSFAGITAKADSISWKEVLDQPRYNVFSYDTPLPLDTVIHLTLILIIVKPNEI